MVSSVATTQAPVAISTSSGCGGAPEMRMLVLMVQTQLSQGEVAKVNVNLNQEQLKELREQVREALEQAREAQEHSGFLGAIGDVLGGDIATLAEVVVLAAATVATGGAAAVVLGAIAIACTVASKYAEELGIPPNVAMGLGIAAAVASVASGNVGGAANALGGAAASGGAVASGGAAVSGGAAAASMASSAGSVASSGAAALGAAAAQANQLTQLAQQVQLYAHLVSAAASGAGGVAHGVAGYYQGEAIDHDADAQAARAQQTLCSIDIDQAIDLFERTVDRQLDATKQTSETLGANEHSKQAIIYSFQGAA